MTAKRHLIKLTDHGLKKYHSDKIDLTKPFVIEAEIYIYIMRLTQDCADSLGISTATSNRAVRTLCIKEVNTHLNEIIIIHEDV